MGGSYAYSGFEYVSEPRTRVAIDPNVRVRGNDTYAGFEDVVGPLTVGELVEVYEAESGLIGEGRVTEIDGDRELVYLSVDWSSLTDELPPRHGPAPAAQLLFIPAGPVFQAGIEDAWMKLMSRPCLAHIGWSETALWVTAPALTSAADLLASSFVAPHLEIWQLEVRPGNALAVAA